jgi:hypothetical protein
MNTKAQILFNYGMIPLALICIVVTSAGISQRKAAIEPVKVAAEQKKEEAKAEGDIALTKAQQEAKVQKELKKGELTPYDSCTIANYRATSSYAPRKDLIQECTPASGSPQVVIRDQSFGSGKNGQCLGFIRNQDGKPEFHTIIQWSNAPWAIYDPEACSDQNRAPQPVGKDASTNELFNPKS